MFFKQITKTIYKVHDFLTWQRSKSLVLSPSFQRRPVWPKNAKSFLIDTIVKGLPIPIIFLREQTDIKSYEPIREVVDGQQRLRTIISFIEPNLINDYDPEKDSFTVMKSHNTEISNKKYSELDNNFRNRLLNYEFSVHVLPSNTEDSEVLQIFARMNSTGVKLNKQELRNAEYFGSMKQFCYDLAYEYLNKWRDWRIFSENDIARMLEVQETSDLILMMINKKIKGQKQSYIDKLYKDYDNELLEKKPMRFRFRSVMDKIDDTYGSAICHSVFSRKILFNTLFTFYYDIMFGLSSDLSMEKPKQIDQNVVKSVKKSSELIQKKNVSDELLKILRGGTGNLESRISRFNFVKSNYTNAHS